MFGFSNLISGSWTRQTSQTSATKYLDFLALNLKPITERCTNRDLGIAALAITAIGLGLMMRKRAQYPMIKWATSINRGSIELISFAKRKVKPVDATITLCIDTSGSMKGDRIKTVCSELEKLLITTHAFIEKNQNARIAVAAMEFDNESKTIFGPTSILNNTNIQDLTKKIKSLETGGNTDIDTALHHASGLLNEIAKKHPTAKHYLVLLTDGTQPTEQTEPLQTVLKTLKKVNKIVAESFIVIGIEGADHQVLKKIAETEIKQNKLCRFFYRITSKETVLPTIGKFIETYSSPKDNQLTIADAIQQTFKQIINPYSFTHLKIHNSQLAKNEWSVRGATSKDEAKGSSFELGTLSEQEKKEWRISIFLDTIKNQFNLNNLNFHLSFYDPEGRHGKVNLRWKNGSLLIPEIYAPSPGKR